MRTPSVVYTETEGEPLYFISLMYFTDHTVDLLRLILGMILLIQSFIRRLRTYSVLS
jgi:hypothetical protein